MLSYIGLVLIIVGWSIQFLNKDKNIDMKFMLLYILGVVLLAIDGFTSGLTELAVLNVISGIAAIAVLVKVLKKN